jgi:hypothetical protein
MADIKDYLSYELKLTQFADRKNIDISLYCSGTPYLVHAVISAEADFKLFDANFPVTTVTNSRYELSIGVNPPPYLLLQLTLPMRKTYTLSLELVYKNGPPGIDINGDTITLEERIIFKKSIILSL